LIDELAFEGLQPGWVGRGWGKVAVDPLVSRNARLGTPESSAVAE
jgi:hypothetical protein